MSNQPTPRYLCPTPVPLELFETVGRLLKRTHLLSGIRAFRGSQMFAHLHAHKYLYVYGMDTSTCTYKKNVLLQ